MNLTKSQGRNEEVFAKFQIQIFPRIKYCHLSTCVIFVVFSYSSGFFLKHEFFLLNFFSRKSSTLKALSFSRTKTTGGQIEFAPEDLT